MKEIKKERTTTQTYYEYEAIDGTMFDNQEECEKYENSALGVLNYKISLLQVGKKDIDCWSLCYGYEDNKCFALKPESHTDYDTILQWYLLQQSWLLKEDCKDRFNNVVNILTKAWHENDIVFFGVNCDGEPYIMNTRNTIIDNLKNFDKDETK